MSNSFINSNQYEVTFNDPEEPVNEQAPPDDRDKQNPDFTVDERLAYNTGVEGQPF